VLYHPERDVAPTAWIPNRLGEAHPRKPHVTGLPRMRITHGPQSAAAAAYATDLFHSLDILQLAPTRRAARKRAGKTPARYSAL
jgi:hypothetical protein